ncbi:MAG: hypothetical protein IPI44_14265 [Sulfuritalea sp.]|nr:hypothetical protein [Sulfuritalea sp.]
MACARAWSCARRASGRKPASTRAVGFLDWAGLLRQEPLPPGKHAFQLGSYGMGLRLRDASGLRLPSTGHALRDGADATGDGSTATSETRMHRPACRLSATDF